VAGYDVVKHGPKIRGLIGVALQEAALDPLLTARDHLRLQATLQSVPKVQRETRAEELLHRVGLVEAADRKVSGYSGGMKRRSISRSRSCTARASSSSTSRRQGSIRRAAPTIWNEVALMRREAGVTVFLTTQYLEEADVLADRVGIIDQGKIVAAGTPAEAEGRDRAPERACDSAH
jgi:ABC-2 type transport system ATP-binding protein